MARGHDGAADEGPALPDPWRVPPRSRRARDAERRRASLRHPASGVAMRARPRAALGLVLALAACGPSREPPSDASDAGSRDGTFGDIGPPDIQQRDYSLPPLDGLAL